MLSKRLFPYCLLALATVCASAGAPRALAAVLPTATSVSGSPNPSTTADSVTFTATVTTSGVPIVAVGAGSSVTFSVDGNAVSTKTIAAAGSTATFTAAAGSLSPGSHLITASYSDTSGTYASSSGSYDQLVKSTTTTALILTGGTNPSAYPQALTFTATVTGSFGPPTGAVQFLKNGNPLGPPITLTAGAGNTATASYTTQTGDLPAGGSPYSITAVYSGDSFNAGSTSNTLTQTVDKGTPTIAAPTSSLNPSTYGQSVTFSTTVTDASGGTPTGSVTFTDTTAGTTIGTATLSSGQASVTTSALPVGAGQTITAAYSGDSNYTAVSTTGSQTVNAEPTTTSVTSSSNPSSLGQAVTFTITVAGQNGITPTGSVTLTYPNAGGTTTTTAGVSLNGNGQAQIAAADLRVGASDTVTATYAASGSFAASSGFLTQTVTATSNSVSLTSSPNPSTFNQSVTFTASVAASAGVTPTGSVQFMDGSSALGSATPLSGGAASIAVTSLSVGSHPITAVYGGDSNYSGATSGTLTQIVNKGDSSTSLTSDNAGPTVGQTVTLTAAVSATAPAVGTPTGTVQFEDGSNVVATVVLSGGSATYQTNTLTVGTHNFHAIYSGDTTFNGNTSNLQAETVTSGGTTPSVSSSANPSVFGQNVTFTATINSTGTTPTGYIQFQIDGVDTGSQVALVPAAGNSAQAQYSTSTLSVANHSVTAVFTSTNIAYSNGSGALAGGQTVNQASSTTTTATSGSPSTFNQSVTFTATVGPVSPGAGTPTGTVQFKDGGTSIGAPQPLASGQATYSTAALSVSTHSITAAYSGDGSFSPSTSDPLTQMVGKGSSTTAVTSDTNPTAFGQTVNFTATVTGSGATPTGTVQFQVDSVNYGAPVTLAGGTAGIADSSLAVGQHSVTGIYSGDGTFSGSTSPIYTQTVGQSPSSTALAGTVGSTTSSASLTSTFNQSVTLTATVTGSGTVPTGTVTFQDTFNGATNTIGSGTLSGSGSSATAAFTLNTLAVGMHQIVAVYGGDTTYGTSSSTPALTVTVSASGTTVVVVSSSNPSVYQQSVSFTATVIGAAGVPPTGSIQFQVDGADVMRDGTPGADAIPLSGGGTTSGGPSATAVLATANLPVGSHTIVAMYSGDMNSSPMSGTMTDATGTPVAQTVSRTGAAVTAASSQSPSSYGQPVTFTATVVGSGAVPTGSVQFQVDGANAGAPVALTAAGSAATGAYTTSTLAPTFSNATPSVNTPHSITAIYSGDANYTGMTSAPIAQTVYNGQPAITGITGPTGPYLLVPGTPRVSVTTPLPASSSQELTITGSGFVVASDVAAGARVSFNGTLLVPDTNDGATITVAIPPTLAGKAGVATVQIVNPNTATGGAVPTGSIPINPVMALPNLPLANTTTYIRMVSFPYDYNAFSPYDVLEGVTLTDLDQFTMNGYDPDINLLDLTSANPTIQLSGADTPLYYWDPTEMNPTTGTQGLYLTTLQGQTTGANGLLTSDVHFVLGNAYWVVGGVSSQILGVMQLGTPAQFNPSSISLQPGWNMIGDPFPSDEPLANLQVLYQGTALPFYGTSNSGVSSGIVSPIFWSYNGTQYQMNYAGNTSGLDTLRAYEGYWLYCYQPCSLLVTK